MLNHNFRTIENHNIKYITLDTRDIYKKYLPVLGTMVGEVNFKEIIRQIFYIMEKDFNYFTRSLMNIPNFMFFTHNEPVTYSEEDKKSIRSLACELGFEIYMNVRQEGLFLDTDSEKSFPFLLEQITPSATYLQVDRVYIEQSKQQSQSF